MVVLFVCSQVHMYMYMGGYTEDGDKGRESVVECTENGDGGDGERGVKNTGSHDYGWEQ